MEPTYDIDFKRIKQEVSFEKIVDYLGLKLKRMNPTQYKGDCPVCGSHWAFGITVGNEKYPTGAFNCFSCKSSGDQIELVSRIRGHGIRSKEGNRQAGKEVWERFITAPAPEPSKHSRVRAVPEGGRAAKLRGILERLQPEHELVQGLGIGPQTASAFQSGFNASGEQRGRYSVPLHGRDGELVGFAGIALNPEQQPKIVLGTGVDPLLIFNAHRVEGADLMIARSMLDLILTVENGTPIESIIAPLTQPTTSEWLAVVTAFLDDRKIESLWL